MIEKHEEKPLREFIILFYEELLESAVKREDYETAAKYKIWIDNLKKLKTKD
jgi:protein-arginine kinase activator protein McsA